MNSKQFTESTTSGAIASVPTPVGKTQTRGKGVYPNEKGGNLLTGKKTNKKYANSNPMKEAKLDEEDIIIVPGQGNRIKPGFIPRDKDRTDHEVEMAKSDLFQANKNTKKIYELIKDIPESVGIEGWVQEKIIKANDYLNTVREYLEHKQVDDMTGVVEQDVAEGSDNLTFQQQRGKWYCFQKTLNASPIGVGNTREEAEDNYRRKTDPDYGGPEERARILDILRNADRQGVAEASDISGLMTAASMVKDYIVTAEVDGVVKKFRIRGVTGPQAAKERFLKHASMAKVLKVEEQGMAEGEEQGTKMNKNCSRCGDSLFRFSNTIKCHKCNQTWKASPKNKENQGVAEGTENYIEKKIKAKQDSLSLAREQRRAKGQRLQGQREIKLQAEIDRLNSELAQMKKQGLNENAEELSIGDPVIITGTNVKYQGATGEIVDFGTNNRFVVVNLYNHGRHSFHSSDVSYNEYADSDKEEAEMYDRDEDFRRWSSTQDIDEGIMGKVLGGGALVLSALGLMPSGKDTPLGKELEQAANNGDRVAAYYLKHLDTYIDENDQRTLINLKIAYIDDSNRSDVKKYLATNAGLENENSPKMRESSVIKGMTDESSYRTIRKVRSELKSEDDLIPSNKPELKGIYFFNNVTPELAKKYSKMKQYKNNKWGIPVYTTSGATTQNAITLATKEFGPHTYWKPKPKSFGESKCPECGGKLVAESELNEEGNKDACYHKVKSRYKVWPSAYASGALVKCRKVGASNWGNKSK